MELTDYTEFNCIKQEFGFLKVVGVARQSFPLDLI